ncbi:hypothetical protein N7449_007439 [Penicillium cf. viridicatum]|uniref:Uncharacterized protein n=1 Tax=Penicillium cf. viridicatum TaxID=2972119 RepID=A0A9W9MC29_9EURO|nr:hypothetical protein N7449_007439 [Penicillium cf. viridicatum]
MADFQPPPPPPNKKRKAHRGSKGNLANKKAKQAAKKAARQALLQDAEAPASDGKAAEEKDLRKEAGVLYQWMLISKPQAPRPIPLKDLPKEAEASASGDEGLPPVPVPQPLRIKLCVRPRGPVSPNKEDKDRI